MRLVFKILLSLVLLFIVGTIVLSFFNITYKSYQKNIVRINQSVFYEESEFITETDLEGLPIQIKNYLDYVGVVGSPKVNYFQAELSGKMKKDMESDFAACTVEQTSYIDPSIRLFYMKMKMGGFKIAGLHHYEESTAYMKIKLLDVFTVTNVSGNSMNLSETVTVFNDMALLAPGSLIDSRITWEEIDEFNVLGTFTNGDLVVSAKFTFDDEYRLINFYSEDRYMLFNDGTQEQVPWSTPISEYKESNGLNIPYKGEGIWHFEEEDYTYIKLTIEDVIINP